MKFDDFMDMDKYRKQDFCKFALLDMALKKENEAKLGKLPDTLKSLRSQLANLRPALKVLRRKSGVDKFNHQKRSGKQRMSG